MIFTPSITENAPKLVIPETLPETFAPTSIAMKPIDPPEPSHIFVFEYIITSS